MDKNQVNQLIAEGKVQPRESYTYADLLTFLQGLSPEQLQQQVWGWDENQCYDQLTPRTLEQDYVSDGEGYGPAKDYMEGATPEELEDMKTWPRLPAGTVVFDIGE